MTSIFEQVYRYLFLAKKFQKSLSKCKVQSSFHNRTGSTISWNSTHSDYGIR